MQFIILNNLITYFNTVKGQNKLSLCTLLSNYYFNNSLELYFYRKIVSMKLFVGGLSANLDDVDFRELFELYGTVQSAILVTDKNTGKSKGFGFIDMPNDAEGKEAMDLLDGVAIFGKKIAVKVAEEQPRKTSTDFNYRSNDRNDSRGHRSEPRNNDRRRY